MVNISPTCLKIKKNKKRIYSEQILNISSYNKLLGSLMGNSNDFDFYSKIKFVPNTLNIISGNISEENSFRHTFVQKKEQKEADYND